MPVSANSLRGLGRSVFQRKTSKREVAIKATLSLAFVLRTGIEPVRPLLGKGF